MILSESPACFTDWQSVFIRRPLSEVTVDQEYIFLSSSGEREDDSPQESKSEPVATPSCPPDTH